MNAPPPESLAEGRFRLLEPIGEGGMATVYRAFDLRLQRPRAIKVLSPALAIRPPLRKRFLSEAHTMAGLEESRVVRIFDMGEDGDFVYIVMELVDGGSLLDRVRDYGPLPPRMAAEATIQICESLQAAHDAGVIHRDIKPHNILLTKGGEIRVTDFGIAQVQSEDGEGMTKTGAVMGTWGFMAPEQKSNAKSVDARADVYSVGATLYSLLTGQTPPELFMADAEPTMLEGIPEELAEVIKRATRYRREDRYVSSRAMAESIRALIPLLEEDPELSVPLVPPTLEKRIKPLDTMQQFASEILPAGPGVQATMVPDAAPEPEAAPAPPARAAEPATATKPLAANDSLVTMDRPKSGLPWGLVIGGSVSLFALAVLALALVVPVLWGTFTEAPVAPPVAAADPAVTPPTPTPPVTTPPEGATPPVVAAPPGPAVPAVATQPATPREGTGSKATPSTPPPAADPTPTPTAKAPDPVVADAEPAPVAKAPAGLVHAPPAAGKVGENLSFAASLPGAGWTVKLYYRAASGGPFQEKSMVASGSTYAATVKATEEMGGGIAYFISATKGSTTLKEGSATSPKKVAIAP